MKLVLVHSVYFLLIVSTLVLIFSIAIPPVIYSLDQDIAISSFHSNIYAEKRLIINSSTDMLPVMQDLLDYSGPIALNIRMKDLEAARDDLDAYAQKYRNLNNLVINLEMNESEIQDFVNNTKMQDNLYRELMNSSYSLDELKRLEFRYRDKGDTVGLTTVAYQGKALKKKIQSVRDRYNVVSQNLINQSETYELDSTGVKKAQQDIDRFVKEIAIDETPDVRTSQNVAKKLSFFITPDKGVYRDTIMYSGFATGSNSSHANVNIFIDNKTYFNVTTDDIGQYRQNVEIQRVSAGVHILSAHWGTISSEEMNLTVTPINSSLVLNISALMFQPVIKTSGVLRTSDFFGQSRRGINFAPVRLVVNDETWNKTRTALRGIYSTNLTLPEGRYLIYSQFSDKSFPVNGSTSQTYEVISSGISITSIKLLGETGEPIVDWPFGLTEVFLGIIIISILGGALWYVRRGYRPGLKINISPAPEIPDEESIQKTVSITVLGGDSLEERIISDINGSLFSRYQAVLKESGLSDAARYVYIIFVGRIAGDIRTNVPLTLTPREVVQKILKQPYSGAFTLFVSRYERIRYGGVKEEEEQKSFETQITDTDTVMSGNIHED